MAREAREFEQDFINTAQEKTGKSLNDWLEHLKTTDLTKTNEMIKYLKQDHKFNHMQAAILTGIYFNDGQPVHDYDALLGKLFAGKEAVRPIYERLQEVVATELPESVDLIPTKTYVSIEGERVFACAKINKKNIRVGLDLDIPFDAMVVPAKGLGAMPNISHMVEVTDPAQIDDQLVTLLQQAYAGRH